MDFSLNPCAKLPHCGRLGLLGPSGWRRSGVAESIPAERGAGHSVAALRFVAGVRSAAGQAVPVLYRGSTRGWQVAGTS